MFIITASHCSALSTNKGVWGSKHDSGQEPFIKTEKKRPELTLVWQHATSYGTKQNSIKNNLLGILVRMSEHFKAASPALL